MRIPHRACTHARTRTNAFMHTRTDHAHTANNDGGLIPLACQQSERAEVVEAVAKPELPVQAVSRPKPPNSKLPLFNKLILDLD